MNNAVKDLHGNLIGYRCHECGGIFQVMWGETCNGCRATERRHQELLTALRPPHAPARQAVAGDI